MENLSAKIVKKITKKIKIMQFGEGNFLRAFVDWIIKKMNDNGVYDGHVVVVQPLNVGRIEELKKQDGLYTLYLQGINNGEKVRTHEIIDVLDDFVNPYSEYDRFLDYARSSDLEVVISNTTEAGITLDRNDLDLKNTPNSFPGKVLALLNERYNFFKGDLSKGLSFICCELIDNNGDELKKCVLELAKLNNLSEEFLSWINNACHFTSTLVDRIVPGYPKDEIEEISKELNYVDNNIVKAEIFHLWVLNKESHIQKIFPCDKAGLNVIYADSIKSYKQRKVKILNGCHTCMVPVSYLYGIDTVRESIEDQHVGKFAKEFVFNEVIQTIDLPRDDMISFAGSVFERYLNPFVRHELMSIALNSISKFKARVLPSIKDYLRINNCLPTHSLFSLAALIKFYEGKRVNEEIKLNDEKEVLEFFKNIYSSNLSNEEIIRKVLMNTNLFGEDLTLVPDFYNKVLNYYDDICELGMKEALIKFLGE